MLNHTAADNGDAPDPTESIVTVATFQSLIEADLVREELEAEGIECWVSNATMTQTVISMPETGLGIQVAGRDADRARVIAAQMQNAAPISDAELENAALSAPPTADNDEIGDANPSGLEPARSPAMYDDAEAGG